MKYSEKLEKSRNYKKSKIYQLKIAMDSIRITNDINVSTIASVILRVLSPKDFEQDYYKMTALLMLASTQDTDSGLIKSVPPMPDDKVKEPVEKRNLLLIYVSTDNDSVKVNDKKVSIEDLTDFAKSYILSDSKDTTMFELIHKHIDLIGDCYQSKLIISLQNDKGTSYSTYIKVRSKLTDAYKKVRNEKALEYFNLKFDKLTDEQQSSIKEMIPLRITEAKPTQ